MNFDTSTLGLTHDEAKAQKSLVAQLSETLRYRVLELFDPTKLVVHSRGDFPANAVEAAILDTEGTGTDSETAGLLELGMVKFCYLPDTLEVLGITGVFTALEDPGIEISPEASLVNGLTQEMVAGHKISDADVLDFLSGVKLVIAHNASYDRQMVERRFPFFAELAWACSYREVEWVKTWGPGASLESICAKQGFYFAAHRAFTDCFALLRALCEQPPVASGMPNALKQLVESARKPSYRVSALGSGMDKTPLLKERRYRWSPGTAPGSLKAWNTSVSMDKLEEELEWLGHNVFNSRPCLIPVEKMTAMTRYSLRYAPPKQMEWSAKE